jgi:hypothetical protein
MSLSIVHRSIVGEERKFLFALAAYQVAVNVKRIAARALDDRQDRGVSALQQVNCRREGNSAHDDPIAAQKLKRKEAGFRRPGLKNRPATGQVKRGTCWI